ncbi:Cobalamin synthase [Sulfitobacter noctilucae]|uniref:adenosylcobinamide-GDP ribazoletransferase n=1 Tax=Sulfitobacter noctilucae TaxID=1342302 RepID=UPI000469E4C3|nr:adenosylcobinamide-GDP ribazoletransferase [Sulfitobacter noctilucae]KIN60439.1 Cobalamin synthase [Sulfitobacter noctilucae]
MTGNDIALPAFRPRLHDVGMAFALLTRLPLPFVQFKTDDPRPAAYAAWAYPLVGIFIGGIMAGIGAVAIKLGLPPTIAALLALVASALVTGAMHEDGLADCADGFWGGLDKARRLEIMKDSQIGTYGVIALLMSLGLRGIALAVLLGAGLALPALLGAAVVSRAAMVAVMYALPHARSGGLSRQTGCPPLGAVGGAAGLALVALLFALPVASVVITLAAVLGSAAVAKAKIGGQTGDVLGATQQLTEISLLLLCVSALG